MPDDDIPTKVDRTVSRVVHRFGTGNSLQTRYTLQRLLGKGGMGVVWLAHDEHLNRLVALKFLPEDLLHDPGAIDDLKRETQKSLELTHPNIVRVYDFLQDAEWVCVSMEYVDGGSLLSRRVEKANRVFDVEELSLWTAQLCDALAYAHENVKLVHRDLKPANLMITGKGHLKLADFGIARDVSETMTRVTGHSPSGGTFTFMSPQQYFGDPPKPTDDIYSLGATLYDLFTSKPPFYSGNIAQQVMDKTAPSMAERRKEFGIKGSPIPPEWESAVAACLSKDPKERPQTARDLAAALYLDISPPEGHKTTKKIVVQPEPIRTIEPPVVSSKRRGVWITAASLAIVAFVALGLWYFKSPLSAGMEDNEIKKLRIQQETQKQIVEAERLRNDREKLRIEGENLKAKNDAETERIRKEHEKEQRATDLLQTHMANAKGGLLMSTSPTGAIVTLGGDYIERSPCSFKSVKIGKYPLKIILDGYDPVERQIEIQENQTETLGTIMLTRQVGLLKITSKPAEADYTVAAVVDHGASNTGVKKGKTPDTLKDLPTGEYEVTVKRSDWEIKSRILVKHHETAACAPEFNFGSVTITSEPSGADVTALGGHADSRERETKNLGKTPLTLSEVKPGEVNYQLGLKGHQVVNVKGTVEPNKPTSLVGRLELIRGPQHGQRWENSLGMRFVPVPGAGVLFCVWETRVRDFETFVKATGHDATANMYSMRHGEWKPHGDTWKSPGFAQDGTHPVCGVNWGDAMAFCRWLTEKELKEGVLQEGQSYRLPSDEEWGKAAGDAKFPWGEERPPPPDVGNYASAEAKDADWPKDWSTIDGRTDKFPRTAPVGSFKPNSFGIYDLGGNVWEWSMDWYHKEMNRAELREKIAALNEDGGGQAFRATRGGSWADSSAIFLSTTFRDSVPPDKRYVIIGFRCVVTTGSGK